MKRMMAITLALCLLLAGCAKAEKKTATVFAMDTVMELSVWGNEREAALTALEKMIRELENTWSVHREGSVISALNAGNAQPEAQQFVAQVQALSQRTGGAFDPQLYSLMALWNFAGEDHRVPTEAQIAEARENKLWDLGGAVKGYAGDQAVEKLKDMDVTCALLNMGGNIQTYGTKPDGTPWSIGIQNPEGAGHLGIVTVKGTMAVVTSGDYQRYFEQEGIRYHHILDPATGKPADSGLRSVTIICTSGLQADVFSTALFVMGLERGAEFWRESDDFEAVFVLEDGSIFATEGVALTGCEFEVIRREN